MNRQPSQAGHQMRDATDHVVEREAEGLMAPSFGLTNSTITADLLQKFRRLFSVAVCTPLKTGQRSRVLPRNRPASPCRHSKGDSSLQLFFRGLSSLHRASRPSSWVKP